MELFHAHTLVNSAISHNLMHFNKLCLGVCLSLHLTLHEKKITKHFKTESVVAYGRMLLSCQLKTTILPLRQAAFLSGSAKY